MAVTRISWWQWLPVFRWRVVATCDEADEVPQALPRNAAVLVVSDSVMKWLVFDCPCRSGHRMMLPLQGKPRWNVVSMKPLSVAPSVDYRGANSRCHYIMRAGNVVWVSARNVRDEQEAA